MGSIYAPAMFWATGEADWLRSRTARKKEGKKRGPSTIHDDFGWTINSAVRMIFDLVRRNDTQHVAILESRAVTKLLFCFIVLFYMDVGPIHNLMIRSARD